MKSKVNALVHSLVALQLRVSALNEQHVTTGNLSPLLTSDRGPQTDLNLIMLPQGRTSLYTGVNDIGGPTSTVNFAAMQRVSRGFQIGGGILYSQLGARALYTPPTGRGFGGEGYFYDPRHPTLDTYLYYYLGGGLSLFGGERDLTHDDRRTAFGLQYSF
jgi:hypothetical protein